MRTSNKSRLLSFRILILSISILSLLFSFINFIQFKKRDQDFKNRIQATNENIANTSTFSPVVENLIPSVVNLKVTKFIKYSEIEAANNPFHFFEAQKNNLLDELLPEDRIKKKKVFSTGSGFFISEDGILITNYHVIMNAKKIEIEKEKDNFLEAYLIGGDKNKDIAILKIKNLKGKVKPINFGNSDLVKVGDIVFAIGSPFGLEGTVTSGIVSAKSRKIGGTFDDFIQTDASINSGSSGGPMINMKGEVIGMNTAIKTTIGAAANVGVGFAVPSNMIIETMEEIKNKKDIKRGKMDIVIQSMDEKFNQALKIKEKGLPIIVQIGDDSPAKAAGVEIGDIIISIDNQGVRTYDEVPRIISTKKPNEIVNIKVNRYGKILSFDIKLKEDSQDDIDKKNKENFLYAIGIGARTVDNYVKNLLKLPKDTNGVIILDILSEDILNDEIIEKGDIISKVNGVKIKDAKHFKSEIEKFKNRYVLLEINKNGTNYLIPIITS